MVGGGVGWRTKLSAAPPERVERRDRISVVRLGGGGGGGGGRGSRKRACCTWTGLWRGLKACPFARLQTFGTHSQHEKNGSVKHAKL